MSRGIPSLKYLAELSSLVLEYQKNLDAEVWKECVILAEEIHALVVPKKGKKRAAREEAGAAESVLAESEEGTRSGASDRSGDKQGGGEVD